MFFDVNSNNRCLFSHKYNNLEKQHSLHLFQLWDVDSNKELMFELKHMIKALGYIYIPIKFDHLSDHIQLLLDQVNKGVETRLYLSNLNCLHALHITKINHLDEESFIEKNKLRIHRSFGEIRNTHWLKIEDIFVVSANSKDMDSNRVSKSLEELICIEGFQSLLHLQLNSLSTNEPIIIFESRPKPIFDSLRMGSFLHNSAFKRCRWVDTSRSLDRKFLAHNDYLKDAVYLSAWEDIPASAKFYLYKFETAKLRCVKKPGRKQTKLLLEAANLYLAAIFHDLDAMFVRPIQQLMLSTPALSDEVATELPILVEDLSSGMEFEELMSYISKAKISLFNLRHKISKNAATLEQGLQIEQVLHHFEIKMEKFLRSDIVSFLRNFIEFVSIMQRRYDQNAGNSVTLNAQLIKVLTQFSSTEFDQNIFLQLFEYKSGKILSDKKAVRIIDDVILEEMQSIHSLKLTA